MPCLVHANQEVSVTLSGPVLYQANKDFDVTINYDLSKQAPLLDAGQYNPLYLKIKCFGTFTKTHNVAFVIGTQNIRSITTMQCPTNYETGTDQFDALRWEYKPFRNIFTNQDKEITYLPITAGQSGASSGGSSSGKSDLAEFLQYFQATQVRIKLIGDYITKRETKGTIECRDGDIYSMEEGGDWTIKAQEGQTCTVDSLKDGTYTLEGPVALLCDGGKCDTTVNFDLGKQAPAVIFYNSKSYGHVQVECSGKATKSYNRFLGAYYKGDLSRIKYETSYCPRDIEFGHGPGDIVKFQNIDINDLGGLIDSDSTGYMRIEEGDSSLGKKNVIIIVVVVLIVVLLAIIAFILCVFFLPALSPVYSLCCKCCGPPRYAKEGEKSAEV